MKIICISDTHGQHLSKKLNSWIKSIDADMIIFAGDIQSNEFDFGDSFLKWFSLLPFTYKVMTFGNHDGHSEIMKPIAQSRGIITLDNETVNIQGINIFGSPNSTLFGNWYHMNTEEELLRIYQTIPTDTHILITHTPAFGILDVNFFGESIGSKSLLSMLNNLPSLKYHVCGHCHEGYGIIEQENQITHINCSVLDKTYRLVNKPFELEIL